MTPYEHWNTSKYLLLSAMIMYRQKGVGNKTKRAFKCYFVGYDEQSEAYRCYDRVAEKVVFSRDVRFVISNGVSMGKRGQGANEFSEQGHTSQCSGISFDSLSNNNNNNLDLHPKQETLIELIEKNQNNNEIAQPVQENQPAELRRSTRSNFGRPAVRKLISFRTSSQIQSSVMWNQRRMRKRLRVIKRNIGSKQ